MKIIKVKELEQFINSQKNDRQVAPFDGSSDPNRIGCVLVHFANSRGWKFSVCSFDDIRVNYKSIATIEKGRTIHTLFRENRNQSDVNVRMLGITNYGQLKRVLKTGKNIPYID